MSVIRGIQLIGLFFGPTILGIVVCLVFVATSLWLESIEEIYSDIVLLAMFTIVLLIGYYS